MVEAIVPKEVKIRTHNSNPESVHARIILSFGAMNTVLSFLEPRF